MHGFWQRKAARPCTFLCMSGSARFRGVQVLSLSGSRKDTAEGRGITLYEGQMKYLGVKSEAVGRNYGSLVGENLEDVYARPNEGRLSGAEEIRYL